MFSGINILSDGSAVEKGTGIRLRKRRAPAQKYFEGCPQRSAAEIYMFWFPLMNRFCKKIATLFLALLAIVAMNTPFNQACHADNLPIVTWHASNYSIVLPAKPFDANADPSKESNRAAALELQRCISLATGVTLPIVPDNEAISSHIISIGQTAQAQAAGISLAGVKDEGFRIVTQHKNLYILGVDSLLTRDGGTSFGSANGVYTFLQKYLDVRWLFPGDLGRDVPRRTTLVLQDIDFQDAPYFNRRVLPYTALPNVTDPEIGLWHRRQRQGASIKLDNRDDSWLKIMPPSLYKDHPDWFAMIKGVRPEPKGNYYKIETTNPEVIQRFAESIAEMFTQQPQLNNFAISPTDADGWSESPESLKLYDKDPTGQVSVTPLVLKFYNDVTAAATKLNPRVKLVGFLYAKYLFPPSKGEVHLEKNFYPTLASSISYGFRLLRKSVQKQYIANMKTWGDATDNLYYYDIPNSFSGVVSKSNAIILPTTPAMVNLIMKNLTANHVKGIYLFGICDWGYGAITNYTWTQMMWNPHQNAYDIQKDWFTRAYGAGAGTVMNQFYVNMEQWFTDFFETSTLYGMYNFSDVLQKNFYAVRYPEIEAAFLKAKSMQMTPVQAKRFKLLENNVITLQWQLKKGGFLPADYHSAYTRNAAEVAELVKTAQTEFPSTNTFGNYTP